MVLVHLMEQAELETTIFLYSTQKNLEKSPE